MRNSRGDTPLEPTRKTACVRTRLELQVAKPKYCTRYPQIGITLNSFAIISMSIREEKKKKVKNLLSLFFLEILCNSHIYAWKCVSISKLFNPFNLRNGLSPKLEKYKWPDLFLSRTLNTYSYLNYCHIPYVFPHIVSSLE